MFAFSNLQFEQKWWLKYTFFQFGWKSGWSLKIFIKTIISHKRNIEF